LSCPVVRIIRHFGDYGNIVRSVMEGQKIKNNAELDVKIFKNVIFYLLVLLILILTFNNTPIIGP
jgi:hypothetical protein